MGPLLLAHVKARAKFVKDEFGRRYKIHRKLNTGVEAHAAPHSIIERSASLEIIGDTLSHNTPPSQWPHRRQKNWITSPLSAAFKGKALYDTIFELSKAFTDECARSGAVKVTAKMRRVTDAIKEARRLRKRRNEGQITLEEQRKEPLRCYGNVFNQHLLEVFAEEYQHICRERKD